MVDVDAILNEREARGLRVPAAVRVGVLSYLALAFILFAPDNRAAFAALPLATALLTANGVFLWQLSRRRHVRLIGYVGAALDATVVLAIAPMWYWFLGRGAVAPGFLAKAPLTIFTLAMIAINSLALRPVYPLIVTAGGLLAHVAVTLAIVGDERTVWATSFVATFTSDAIAALLLANEIVIVAVVGLGLAYLSRMAQQTIRQAVELESENSRMRQQHLHVLMEQKVTALAKLVASISHELNTPLGALQAGVDTQARATERLQSVAGSGANDALARPLRAIGASASSIAEAATRIDATVRSLRRFARLDEGARKRVDLHECIDSAIAMLPEQARGADLRCDYEAPAQLECDPGQLNQALLALLTHACAASTDGVDLSTRTRDGCLCVEIAYGAERAEGPEVFDVALAAGTTRVAAAFDLPIAHSIVAHQGGSLELEHRDGRSRIVVRLSS